MLVGCLAGPRGMTLSQPARIPTFTCLQNPPNTYELDDQSPSKKFHKRPTQDDLSSRPLRNEIKHHNELK
jgi:hypothetical protein